MPPRNAPSHGGHQGGGRVDPAPLGGRGGDAGRGSQPSGLPAGELGNALDAFNENGAWNMFDEKLYQPAVIAGWVIVVYATHDSFNDEACRDMADGFVDACASVGITVQNRDPLIKYEIGQGNIAEQLEAAGRECKETLGGLPSLMLVVLPEGGNDIKTAVKDFDDVTVGIATQCLEAQNCRGAKPQYWANVLLEVNVKLGGINVIPDSSDIAALSDPANPTIFIGADVTHPGPGATDRPSFAAVVGSVDSNAVKYVATSRVQTARQEIIHDLKDMCKEILLLYMKHRLNAEGETVVAPKRLIFYRDGISQGQFKHVLDLELPLIKQACEELEIQPKITLIMVGNRQHTQFFPMNNKADKDAPAGSVIDTGIAHPTEFDFILESHAGSLGTSRPGRYTVLYDDFGFNADSIQALSSALCHGYARPTRLVSNPAPVYYADLACARAAKNHFNPTGDLGLSDTSTQASSAGPGGLEAFE